MPPRFKTFGWQGLTWVVLLYFVTAQIAIPGIARIRAEWSKQEVVTWDRSAGGTGNWNDLDTHLITEGLRKAPRFSDTWKWWVGSWAAEQVAFYRPVPSLAFWAQWKLFTRYEGRYYILSVVLGAAVAVALTLVLPPLLRRLGVPDSFVWQATLCCVVFYFTGFAEGFDPDRVPSNKGAWVYWKNQVELWASLWLLVSLGVYLKLRRNSSRLFPLFFLPLFLAYGSKEVVTLAAPFLCAVLEIPAFRSADRAERRNAVIRVAAVFLFTVAFHLFRLWALRGVGFTYGSNSGWKLRLFSALTLPFGPRIVLRDVQVLLMSSAFALLGLLWLSPERLFARIPRPPRQIRIALSIATFVLLVVLIPGAVPTDQESLPWHIAWITKVVILMEQFSLYGNVILACALAPFLFCLLLRRYPLVALFGYVWILFTWLPNCASPGPPHRFYNPNLGWIPIYGVAMMTALAWAWERIAPDQSELAGATPSPTPENRPE